MKKYKLKLDYTEEELKELKKLGEDYSSPMTAVNWIVSCNNQFISLWRKYRALDNNKDFDFMADINNVIMGNAVFPEEKYVVHDKVTDRYIYYSVITSGLCWRQPQAGIPEIKTKDEWLAISPAYGLMLEKV